MLWRLLVCVFVGFFLGGLNGAILISRFCMKGDIREKGSGNAGLTNYLRIYGGWNTLLVVLIDGGKVILACLLAKWLLPEYAEEAKMITGAAVQIGHIFPLLFHLQGGKGILCSGFLALMMDWRIFLVAFGVFVIVFLLTNYVSLGSILATVVYAVGFVIVFHDKPVIWGMAVFMAALAIFMHRSNIGRLIRRKENKTYLTNRK